MTSEMPSTGERAFGSAEMGTLSVLCVASPGAHCCWNPSLKTKNSSNSVSLKLWRPFPNLFRRVCGGSGSFKEYPGLFSAPGVQGGESSSRTRRVTALIPQAAPHRAGRESLWCSLALREAKQDSKPWVWTKVQLLAAASLGAQPTDHRCPWLGSAPTSYL